MKPIGQGLDHTVARQGIIRRWLLLSEDVTSTGTGIEAITRRAPTGENGTSLRKAIGRRVGMVGGMTTGSEMRNIFPNIAERPRSLLG